MDGGPGTDTADYQTSTAAVQINLGVNAPASGGFAEGDLFVSIENIVGTALSDDIQGSGESNLLRGGGGDDTMVGGDGNDVLFGDGGSDTLDGGNGDDRLHPGFGDADRVVGGPGLDTIVMLGHSSDYTIAFSGSAATITDGTNTATATGVEFVQFSDVTQLLSAVENAPPTAGSQLQFTTPEDMPLEIDLTSVLAAMTDPEQDEISFAGINAASGGRVALNGSSLNFLPARFFNGEATVNFTVHDNHGNFVRVAVAITVSPVNTVPECRDFLMSFPAKRQGTNLRDGRVRAFDIDSNDTLSYTTTSPPTDGTIVLLSNGSFTFDATGMLAGEKAAVGLTATDTGGLSCTALLVIQVTGFPRVTPTPGRRSGFVAATSAAEALDSFSVDYIAAEYDTAGSLSLFEEVRFILGGPKVAVLATGEIVHTWAAVGVDEEGLGIAARMYDSLGNVIRDRFTVNVYVASDQTCPALTALSDGGFLIAWQSQRQDASSFGVYFQRFDRLGFRVGDETRANDEIISHQSNPVVLALPGGGFVVSWLSIGQDGDSFGVFAKVYSGGAKVLVPEFQINTFVEGAQQMPALAVLPSGRWLVAWESFSPEEFRPAGLGIFGQLFEPTGDPVGSNFQINDAGAEDSMSAVSAVAVPASAEYPDGVFFVAYTDNDEIPGPADGFDISAVAILPNGSRVGPEERVNRFSLNGSQASAQLFKTTNPDGETTVVAIWDDNWAAGQLFTDGLQSSGAGIIFGAPLNPDGTLINTRFTLHPNGAGSPLNGAIVIAYQEMDFDAQTVYQRLAIRVNRRFLRLTAPLTLIGTPGNDILMGGIEDDILFGGPGSDLLVGEQLRSINDKALYREPHEAFSMAKLGPALWEVTELGTGDTDILHGIEIVEFSNYAVRINSAPVAVEDVINPAAGSLDIVANDNDVEDGTVLASSIEIVEDPAVGRVSFVGGNLSVRFLPGDVMGFSQLRYVITDSEGLQSRSAAVRIRLDCDAVIGTSTAETIVTGGLDDAAACGNSFTMTGLAGADVFTLVRRRGARDVITDFAVSGADADQIALTDFPSITTFDQVLLAARQVGADTVINLAGEHVVTLLGVVFSSLTADHFGGALGSAPLRVNTYRHLGHSSSRELQMGLDTITMRQATARGAITLNELFVRPEDYAQSLVVWESYPNNYPGALQPAGSLPAQDGSQIGLFGQFLDALGNPRGGEFMVNSETALSQFEPVVVSQPIFGWFWVFWQQSYVLGSETTQIMGNAILYDGAATCSNRDAISNTCNSRRRGVAGPEFSFTPRSGSGQMSGIMAVSTGGDGIQFPGHGMTIAFYSYSSSFCCSLIARTFAVLGGSTINTNFIRIDDPGEGGTQLNSGSGRNAIAALSYDPTLQLRGTFIGQLAVIGWLRIVNVAPSSGSNCFTPGTAIGGCGSGLMTILMVRSLDTVRRIPLGRLEIAEAGGGTHSFTTAFQIIALEEGTITERSSIVTDSAIERERRDKPVNPFSQFVVVHGFGRSTGSTTAGVPERIALSVFTNAPFSGRCRTFPFLRCDFRQSSHVLHTRNFIPLVASDAAGGTLGERGLSACRVPGGVAIAWGHKFPFANRPVILVQLFSLNATALGQYQIVSGFAGGQGSSVGPPLHPLVKLNADSTAIIVIWNQAKALDTTTNSDVLSKTIPLSELTNPPGPVCSDDAIAIPEDTVAVIRPDQLLGNDVSPDGDVLTIVGLKLLPGRSSLFSSPARLVPTTTDARGAPVADPGTLETLQSTVTRPGLRAVYYPVEEILEDMTGQSGPLLSGTTVRAVGPILQNANLTDFDRLEFDASPNTVKFPPDIVGTLPTLHQTAVGTPAPPPTSGQPALTVVTARPGLGTCRVIGNCVTNTNPEDFSYGSGEFCIIRVDRAGTLTATAFETEGCCNSDHVVGGGRRYNGAVGPDSVRVAVGEEWRWSSSVFRRQTLSGWTMCWSADGDAGSRSLTPWAGFPAYMTSNYFAVVMGTLTLDRAESSVEFLVSANSAAALYIDNKLVMISRERRARSGPIGLPAFESGSFGPGKFIVGTGLVSALAAGPHTVRLHYYSNSPAPPQRQKQEVAQTYEFDVRWRRQSNAASCDLDTCYPAVFNDGSPPPQRRRQAPPPPPPPPPPAPAPVSRSPRSQVPAFEVVSGGEHCQLTNAGQCVTDGVGVYGYNEACLINVLQIGTVTSTVFATDVRDRIIINEDCTGISQRTQYALRPRCLRRSFGGPFVDFGPDLFPVSPNSTIEWASDATDGSFPDFTTGWTICFAEFVPSVSPTAAPFAPTPAPTTSAPTLSPTAPTSAPTTPAPTLSVAAAAAAAPRRGVDNSAYQAYRDGVCCGAAFVPIPLSVLSHESPVQSDGPATYAYSPPPNGFGTAVLEYTVTNPAGQQCSAELAITVEPANDAPVASDDALELDSLFGQLDDVCRNASVELAGRSRLTGGE